MLLTDLASQPEIDKLVGAHIRGTVKPSEVKMLMDEIKKKFIYARRNTTRTYKTRDPRFDPAEFDKILWRHYLLTEIDSGRTTQDIAEELELDLAHVNTYLL